VITGRRDSQLSVEHGLFSLSKVIFEFHSVMFVFRLQFLLKGEFRACLAFPRFERFEQLGPL